MSNIELIEMGVGVLYLAIIISVLGRVLVGKLWKGM